MNDKYQKLEKSYNHLMDSYNWISEYILWGVLKNDKLTTDEKLSKIQAFFDERYKGKRECLDTLVSSIYKEYRLAEETYPPFSSAHQGYDVILGELKELEGHILQDSSKRDVEEMKTEARHVAATALRFMFDVCPHENDMK